MECIVTHLSSPKNCIPVVCSATLTVDIDGSMQFPYIMGPNFHNRPLSQNILLNTTEQLEPIGVSYDLWWFSP